MSRIAECQRIGKYLLRMNPAIWQIPNCLKIHEFRQITGPVRVCKGQRALDLGCGRGIQAQLLARLGLEVTGVDPGEKYVRNGLRELKYSVVRDRVQLVLGTIEETRLQDASMDYMFSFSVLEHIPDLASTLRAVHRVLKRGGELHFTVDSLSNINDPEIVRLHKSEYKVCRYFTADSVRDTLEAAGFELFFQRFILASEFAKRKLTEFLLHGSTQPVGERKREYRILKEEEQKLPLPQNGIMMLCRARKRD